MVHIVGFVVCVTILTITIYEKFGEGGWITLLLTGLGGRPLLPFQAPLHEDARGRRSLRRSCPISPRRRPYNNEPVDPQDL